MKVVVVVKKVLSIILACLLIIFVASILRIKQIEDDNKYLNNEINKQSKTNEDIIKEKTIYQQKINDIKEERKEKWEELNLWLSTKEKLNKALS